MSKPRQSGYMKFVSYLIGGIIVLAIALFLSILFGDAKIDIPTIIDAIFNYNPKINSIM